MVRLAFLWHHHQPCYRDPVTGHAPLPWPRLHGTKDYYGMARLVSEFPRIRATFNLAPTLIEQLEDFARSGASDAWLDVMRPEAASLSPEERQRVVELGFYANPKTMIAPFPRYEELFRKKLVGARFSAQEILDLQVLSNLCWFHRTLLAEDPLLVRLREKGRGYTEEEKRALLDRAREVVASVLALYRRLEEQGQIEITTSPFYHPILPLLCNFRSALEAMPWLAPHLDFADVSLREDAEEQVRRAVALHERTFGRRPRGMWPSEGSVSADVVALAAAHGFRWIATDEEILAHSLGAPLRRDAEGNMIDGALLYRPWRARCGGAEVSIVFRDRRLSDLFGFDYHRDPEAGVRDFLRRLAWIRDRVPLEDPLVSVILDGENAWEHYPEGAVSFFRALYGELQSCDWVETVRIGDEIARRPPGDVLPRLFAGSWIDHNFAIWIGHEDDRRAWRLLLEARKALVEAEAAGGLAPEKRALAWRSVYIAEGSDWTWWYGDDRSSGMDDVFDAIFRRHVGNVYRAIGRAPPPEVETPIASEHAPPVKQPTGFLNVQVDGRRTSFFEWLAAGRFVARDEAGAMARAQAGAIEEIAFGFDAERLFVALDLEGEPGRIFRDGGAIHLQFVAPKEQTAVIEGPGRLALDGAVLPSAAVGEIVEVEIPWARLAARPGDEVRFYAAVVRPGLPPERAPRSFAIRVTVPDPEFPSRVWTV